MSQLNTRRMEGVLYECHSSIPGGWKESYMNVTAQYQEDGKRHTNITVQKTYKGNTVTYETMTKQEYSMAQNLRISKLTKLSKKPKILRRLQLSNPVEET
jgi:hypothetical protein